MVIKGLPDLDANYNSVSCFVFSYQAVAGQHRSGKRKWYFLLVDQSLQDIVTHSFAVPAAGSVNRERRPVCYEEGDIFNVSLL